jgi:RNA polymerase-binding transcription factor DksA
MKKHLIESNKPNVLNNAMSKHAEMIEVDGLNSYPFASIHYPDTTADLVDRAQYQAELFNRIALRTVNMKINHQKLRAWEQSKRGLAGICEMCGIRIAKARLQANEWATRCLNCQKEYEKHCK